MSAKDHINYIQQQKLLMLQQQHKEFDQHFNMYRLQDGYIKGQGNKKCNIGRLDVGVNPPDPLYFDNGINPNSGMVTALPQNEAGFIGGAPGYSTPPLPVPRTSNAGANSHDVSANGTEADIFSCSNAGVDYTDNRDCKATIARHGLGCFRTSSGQLKWFGNWTEPVAGQEFNTDMINGKTRLTEAITSDFDKLSLHLRPGMHATGGIGNSTVVQGQGGTWEARVGANEKEVDPEVDYISAGVASGSEENEIELKQNEYNEFCSIKMDANNGKITLNVTGGENQYSSTIIMTGDDITCITHVFNVLAEDEINMLAGQQKSSIIMDKDQIAITNNEKSSIVLTKPSIDIQSLMILENAKTLLKMDAAMIMENCKSKSGAGGAAGIAGKLASIGTKLTALASNITSAISGALASSGLGGALSGALGNMSGALGGALGNISGALGGALSGVTSQLGAATGMLGNLQGMAGNLAGSLGGLSSLSNLGGLGNITQGLSGAANILGNSNLGGIGNALQSGLGNISGMAQQIQSGIGQQIGNITGSIQSNIQQGMQTISNATQMVNGVINQGTQALGSVINGATTAISGAVQTIQTQAGSIVSGTIGKIQSTAGQALGGAQLPSINDIPVPIMHLNSIVNDSNSIIHTNDAADENNYEQYIKQQQQIIYNTIYNMDINEEEKQNLYLYYITLYNYIISIEQICNIILIDFSINLFTINLLNIYMIDVQDYTNNINLIVQDYINNSKQVTINQIIHDQNDKKIQCLQMKKFFNTNLKNDIIKQEIIKLLDEYIDNYINLTNNLIILINKLSNIKIDLGEVETINEDNELYNLL